jgi:hypothetical protein
MAVMVSAAMFFSTITGQYLAAMFTLGFYFIGHFNDLIGIEAAAGNPALTALVRLLYYCIPNLDHFTIQSTVVYGLDVSWNYIGLAILYGASYCLLLLIAASLLFSYKDL